MGRVEILADVFNFQYLHCISHLISFPGLSSGGIKGSTAQFGKKAQTGFLPQFKVPKMEEYCMYFPFWELQKWGKKTAETRRRNYAVLP